MLQLPQRLRLDLADAFAGDRELLADFLQRVVGVHAYAEAHAQDAFLARGEGREHPRHGFLQIRLDRGVDRDDGVLVLDEIAEVAVFLVADRGFEADRLLGDLHHLADLLQGHGEAFGELFRGRLAAGLVEELAEKLAMPLEKVRKVLKIAKEPISLETPIGDEEDSHLGDFIEDKNAILPIDAAIQSNLRETTTRVLASLTPREERVLRMRFGIGMNTDHTLEEVGQQFSVTRERIRQIEAKALRKLKHPSRSRKLRSFLDN